MAIGTHKPKKAKNRCWKDCIGIVLDETTIALEESLIGLSDEQAWSRPIADRHSIGTMAMHCLESLNGFTCWAQLGKGVEGLEEEAWFDLWSNSPEQVDALQKEKQLPSVAQMIDWVGQVRQMALAGLESASEQDLLGPRVGSDWCNRTGRTAGDAYMRPICHVMAHIRQIWCIRGVMGQFGPDRWPQQHYD